MRPVLSCSDKALVRHEAEKIAAAIGFANVDLVEDRILSVLATGQSSYSVAQMQELLAKLEESPHTSD